MINDLFSILLGLAAAAVIVHVVNEFAPQIHTDKSSNAVNCEARGGVWLRREMACVAAPTPRTSP